MHPKNVKDSAEDLIIKFLKKNTNFFINYPEILKELNVLKGLIFYSVFMLPEDKKKSENFFYSILRKKKEVHLGLIELLKLKEKILEKELNKLTAIPNWLVNPTLSKPINMNINYIHLTHIEKTGFGQE